jgi:hypothetical protein
MGPRNSSAGELESVRSEQSAALGEARRVDVDFAPGTLHSVSAAARVFQSALVSVEVENSAHPPIRLSRTKA